MSGVIKHGYTVGYHIIGGRLPTEYKAWSSMKQRCNNSKAHKYHIYGGRGITICSRWLNSFENFLADMGPKPGPEFSLDRIDNDGNYEPNNCRWATLSEQSKNRRRGTNGRKNK